jgi:hypothetical protein
MVADPNVPSLPGIGTPHREPLQPDRYDDYLASAFDASLWRDSDTSAASHIDDDPWQRPQIESQTLISHIDASWPVSAHHQHEVPSQTFPVDKMSRVAKTSRRKGKRQHPLRNAHVSDERTTVHSPKASSDSGSNHDSTKLYHCTVCMKAFKDTYAWKRHESGVHGFNSTQWVCMLNDAVTVGMKCIFCSDIVSNIDHFEQHDMQVCMVKDRAERTFARKDLLKQHVQHVHLANANDYVKRGFEPPETWSEKECVSFTDPTALWCGFCQQMLESTTVRMNHVAQHFREGLDMGAWVSKPDGLVV